MPQQNFLAANFAYRDSCHVVVKIRLDPVEHFAGNAVP